MTAEYAATTDREHHHSSVAPEPLLGLLSSSGRGSCPSSSSFSGPAGNAGVVCCPRGTKGGASRPWTCRALTTHWATGKHP